MARDVDAYFVCATPRTGSSLLLGLLESTGVAGRPQAYFRTPDEPLWADRWGLHRDPDGGVDHRDFLAAALATGRTGNGVFGAKLMWGTPAELVARLATVHPDSHGDLALLERAFGRVRFVHLRRADPLAQAVSWLRAEQTGRWFVGGNGEISGAAGGGGAARYDRAAIDGLLATIAAHDAAWRDWFDRHGVRPHPVRYEELAADPVGVTLGVLDFLGLDLPAGRAVTPAHRRQADALNAAWIARHRLR
ncbi:Stf0 family sulfotransferase [Micromonospora mirobrigensis]|uniref:Trehalose 2-sulfotransferase n=1 Tax=Micromonospora mirobrigensis TaxID=262898 RepID=A0A1C4YVM6_9ACTN|nr:Stf0 family sulfotransferase [Micromonospora mirobrigensis]SCF24822.1 LPS sulfotransferase NodH [Micromonospora mirobrigensis]